jgi:hypothetical protein
MRFPGRTWRAVDAFDRTLDRQVLGSSPRRRTLEYRPLRGDSRRFGLGCCRTHTAGMPRCLSAAYRRERLRTVGWSERLERRDSEGGVRAQRGTGRMTARGGRIQAQVSPGVDAGGRRIRRSRTVDGRVPPQAWIVTQQAEHGQLTDRVSDERLADYLRWWLAAQAPGTSPAAGPGTDGAGGPPGALGAVDLRSVGPADPQRRPLRRRVANCRPPAASDRVERW